MDIRTETASFNDQPHVLIAGDHSETVANLQHLLEQHDYEVSIASKESDAFRQILDTGPDAVVWAAAVSAQQSDSGPMVTEKAQDPAGEISLLEMVSARTSLSGDYANVIGESAGLLNVLNSIELFANSPTAVLISGETGTGKELVAHALCEQSNRSKKKMIVVNCAGISENLVESELFGHEKGAFTGAATQHIGLFETAKGGTLFLDEIGDLSMSLQPKLLRVLQEGEIRRVGGTSQIPVDVRVLAATNHNLAQDVKEGKFRQDLYQRLKTLEIPMPALRERLEDIPVLVEHFLETESLRQSIKRGRISSQALALLQDYDWPGNIRELQSFITRALLLAKGGTILPIHFPAELQEIHTRPRPLSEGDSNVQEHPTVTLPIGLTLQQIQRVFILKTLAWLGENRTQTAKVLGISARTLRERLKIYAISY